MALPLFPNNINYSMEKILYSKRKDVEVWKI